MATSPQESGSARTPGYPAIPEETWWRLRQQFKARGQPRPAWNEDYLINMGIRQNKASARNVVRPFKRIGLFTDDGKPTDRYWDWMDDSKYPEVCKQIIHDLYPESVVHTFIAADDDERERLENWFQRTLDVSPAVAAQYASFYMLLLAGDSSKQDEATASKTLRTLRTPKATSGQTSGSRPRPNGAKAQAASTRADETYTSDTAHTETGHEDEHHRATPKRAVRGIEPSLNINIQIHIPAEASPDQIEQIFKSMAKHLYQRQDEASE